GSREKLPQETTPLEPTFSANNPYIKSLEENLQANKEQDVPMPTAEHFSDAEEMLIESEKQFFFHNKSPIENKRKTKRNKQEKNILIERQRAHVANCQLENDLKALKPSV
ncbi:13922_t:CDS:2, partial [Cetraspora pellucida]